MSYPTHDPGLERLWLEVELTRLRMRARFAGIGPDEFSRWYAEGAKVPDEDAYLEWLIEQRDRREKREAVAV